MNIKFNFKNKANAEDFKKFLATKELVADLGVDGQGNSFATVVVPGVPVDVTYWPFLAKEPADQQVQIDQKIVQVASEAKSVTETDSDKGGGKNTDYVSKDSMNDRLKGLAHMMASHFKIMQACMDYAHARMDMHAEIMEKHGKSIADITNKLTPVDPSKIESVYAAKKDKKSGFASIGFSKSGRRFSS